MEKKRKKRIPSEELAELAGEGLISEAQKKAIEAYYSEAGRHSDGQLAPLLLGILAVLLVGGGIIMIFANSWEHLNAFWRTVLAAAPVLLGSAVFVLTLLRFRDRPVWREGASGLLVLTLVAGLGMLEDTYRFFPDDSAFLLCWLLLSFPFVYWLNSGLVLLIYLFGLTGWCFDAEGDMLIYYWPLLFGVFPMLWRNLSGDVSMLRKNVLQWGFLLSFLPAWLRLIDPGIPEYGIFLTAVLLANFFWIGIALDDTNRLWLNPLALTAAIGTYLIGLILTDDLQLEAFRPESLIGELPYESPAGGWIFAGIAVLLTGLFLYALIGRHDWKRHISDWSVMLFPLFGLLYLFLARQGGPVPELILANLYVLGMSLAFLKEGLERDHLFWVNLGMLGIVVLASVRFFDSDWDPVAKGLVYIGLGLAFLGVNAYLWKSRKEK